MASNLDCENNKSVVLALGGAFNPVHTQHIEVMKIAKNYLENQKGFKVVEAFLAPAPHGYVKTKMKGGLVIKSEHRIAMCNLAVENYDWLKPIQKCYGSALACANECKSDKNHDVVIVVGADRAITSSGAKWRKSNKSDTYTVFIGRQGETEKIKEIWDNDLKTGSVSDMNRFFFVDIDAKNVSSTKVREKLMLLKDTNSTVEKTQMIENLVTESYLDSNVANYIMANESSLYAN